jgi:hypothetical protein
MIRQALIAGFESHAMERGGFLAPWLGPDVTLKLFNLLLCTAGPRPHVTAGVNLGRARPGGSATHDQPSAGNSDAILRVLIQYIQRGVG